MEKLSFDYEAGVYFKKWRVHVTLPSSLVLHFFSIKGKGYLQGVCYDINKYIRGISLSSFSTTRSGLIRAKLFLGAKGQ